MDDAGEFITAVKDVADLVRYGKKMVEHGLVSAHAGNVSKRLGNALLISTGGSMLDELEGKIVQVPLEGPSPFDHVASSELPMHRAIYQHTQAVSVFHGHGRFSIIESLAQEDDRLVPADSESAYYLSEIPIIEGGFGSEALGQAAAKALKDHRGALIRGHGVIARGESVEEAYAIVALIEQACHIRYHLALARALHHQLPEARPLRT